MRKAAWFAVLPLTLVISLANTARSAPSPLRQEFEALLQRGDELLARKDVNGVMDTFAAEFKGVGIEGTVYNKEVARRSLEQSLSFAQSLRARTRLLEVKLVRGEAVDITREHTELRIVGRGTGRIHSLIFDGTWRNVWIKTPGGWKVRQQKQLTQTITRDGKSSVVEPKAVKKADR
jgi:hypothetical protein